VVPRPRRDAPRLFSSAWPDEPCADPIAEIARNFALAVRDALDGMSLRSAESLTGVDHSSIGDIVGGLTWPDLATIARLERGLDAELWPGRARPAEQLP